MKYIILDSLEGYETLIAEINNRRNITIGTYSYPIIGANNVAMQIGDDEIAILNGNNKQRIFLELPQGFFGDNL